jgi:hypothetical protein
MNKDSIIRDLKSSNGAEGLVIEAGFGGRVQVIAFVYLQLGSASPNQLLLERADGEVDPSSRVLLNPGNATDGT